MNTVIGHYDSQEPNPGPRACPPASSTSSWSELRECEALPSEDTPRSRHDRGIAAEERRSGDPTTQALEQSRQPNRRLARSVLECAQRQLPLSPAALLRGASMLPRLRDAPRGLDRGWDRTRLRAKNVGSIPIHFPNGGAGGRPVLGGSEREFTAGNAVLNNDDATAATTGPVPVLTSRPLRRRCKPSFMHPERGCHPLSEAGAVPRCAPSLGRILSLRSRM
jgi:hypothetical protein